MKSENTLSGEDALAKLIEGNARFAADSLEHPNQSPTRCQSLTAVQNPFAVIVGCSDSRVPPEIIFDCGIGDLFVIRLAGNIVDDSALGSIEYAVEHLNTPLIVVLGHTRCGAVDAAIKGGELDGHIGCIADAIRPAVEKTATLPGNHWDNAVSENAARAAEKLKSAEPILAAKYHAGELKIVSAVYDVNSGLVNVL